MQSFGHSLRPDLRNSYKDTVPKISPGRDGASTICPRVSSKQTCPPACYCSVRVSRAVPPPRGCNQTPPSFGAIEIVGNVRVDDAVIRRHLVYRPGEPFHLDALRESESRLTRLALFESATIEVLGTPDSDVVPTRVRVEEAGQRQVTVGGAYGSEGHLWAEGQFRHVNFLGGARTLGVAGRWSSIDRGGRVEFVEPRLFGPRYSLRATGDAQWVEEPTYSLHRGGGAVHVTRRFGPTWPPSTPTETTVSFAYASSTVDVGSVDGSAPESGSLDGVLSTVAVDFHRDTTESVLDPRQGYRVSARSGAGWWVVRGRLYVRGDPAGRAALCLARRPRRAGQSSTRWGAVSARFRGVRPSRCSRASTSAAHPACVGGDGTRLAPSANPVRQAAV